jgi:hypothetical protein
MDYMDNLQSNSAAVQPSETATERAARQYVERWRQQLLTGLWAVIAGNKGFYKEFKKEWKALCAEPTEDEIRLAMESIPENMRWWDVEEREPSDKENLLDCLQCGRPLKNHKLKACPSCKVVLHARCFDEYSGGYETPECECCRERCSEH